MDTILRAAAMYLFLLVVFRLAGKRTLSEADTFDFLMVLIISETTQQAMVGQDHSFTNAMLLIITLVTLTIIVSHIKQRSKRFSRLVDDMPLVVLVDGKILQDRAGRLRVDEDDIIEAARETHGLEHLDQIKYAVMERNGCISIIPK